MPLKRVLIITYYWPPSGGPGVQRWLKFVKYMRNYGWEPIIYTPSNPELQYKDTSLLKEIPQDIEILKTPIIDPLKIAKKVFKKKAEVNLGSFSKNTEKSIGQKIMLWVRANIFIPDPRIVWVKPSVRFLSAYLRQHPVDAIVSTSTPQSMHLIALAIKKKFKIKWLADFRDPWTKMHFFDELPLNNKGLEKHKNMEISVLQSADVVTVIGENMGKMFNEILPRKYNVLTNGFDTEDYQHLKNNELDDKFSITHIGTLLATANHKSIWQAIKELCESESGFKEDLQLKFIGQVDPSIFDSIREYGMANNLLIESYKNHDEIFKLQRSAQVLLLTIASSKYPKLIITGKIFEYLAARRPILGVVPIDGDAANIILESKAGMVASFDDITGIKSIILKYYLEYKSHSLQLANIDIDRYSRIHLTERLCELLSNA